jgi:hypothetical protein
LAVAASGKDRMIGLEVPAAAGGFHVAESGWEAAAGRSTDAAGNEAPYSGAQETERWHALISVSSAQAAGMVRSLCTGASKTPLPHALGHEDACWMPRRHGQSSSESRQNCCSAEHLRVLPVSVVSSSNMRRHTAFEGCSPTCCATPTCRSAGPRLMPLLEVVWVISPRPRLATRPETTLRRRSHGSASCAARSGGQGWSAAPPRRGSSLPVASTAQQ